MQSSLALASILSATLLGCASEYESFYRETERELEPVPVRPEEVRVIRSADDLHAPWTELGHYEGHAPTVKEAMDVAKRTCGRAGADYFILDVEPFEARGVWKVEGICATRQG